MDSGIYLNSKFTDFCTIAFWGIWPRSCWNVSILLLPGALGLCVQLCRPVNQASCLGWLRSPAWSRSRCPPFLSKRVSICDPMCSRAATSEELAPGYPLGNHKLVCWTSFLAALWPQGGSWFRVFKGDFLWSLCWLKRPDPRWHGRWDLLCSLRWLPLGLLGPLIFAWGA